MQWTVTAPIELLWFIVATPTPGPFNAQIGDTIDRNGHYSGMHYPTDHWHDSPQWLQPPVLMRWAGKQWDCWVPKSRGAVGGWSKRCGDAPPLPTQTRRLREVTRAESNLLLKIRIYKESSGGTKLSARTATGLHCRSRLKSCMRNTWKLARK